LSGSFVTRPVIGPVVVNPGGGVLDPGTSTGTALLGTPLTVKIHNSTLYVSGSINLDKFWFLNSDNTITVIRNNLMVGTFSWALISNVAIAGLDGNDEIDASAVTKPLIIYGGNGNDSIKGGSSTSIIFGNAGNDTLTGNRLGDRIEGGDGNDMIFGGSGNDSLWGGIGNDTIDAGSGDDVVYGQDGNDTEFAGPGNDTLFGGNGDDTLITVFGGNDRANGDQGWDIFVADKSPKDTITDMDNLAVQRKSIYLIDKFANPTFGSTFASELLVNQDIADPSLTLLANKYVNFSSKPLFTSKGPKMVDVQQNQLNDCWLASTAASLAESNPFVIRRTVIPLGDGTFAVALGNSIYRMDADLPTNANGNPIYGSIAGRNGESLWFGLLEKGMAYHMKSGTRYTYADTELDTPGVAFNALRVAYDRYQLLPFGTNASSLWDRIRTNPGKAMVITTEPASLGVNSALRPSHAYSILGTFTQGPGTKMISLRNPTDRNGSNSGTNGLVSVSTDNVYASCLLFYVSKLTSLD